MRNIFLALATMSLACLLCSPAQADLRWNFSPDFQVRQEYTDNLFLTEDDKESDWITLLTAGFQLQADGRTHGMSLSYRPSYSFYQEYDEFDSLRHNADLQLWKDLTKHLSLTLSDNFTRSEQPGDPDRERVPLVDDQGRIIVNEQGQILTTELERSREPRSTNNARARLDYQYGPEHSAYAQYVMQHNWSDDPLEEDSVRYSPSLGFDHAFGRLYSLQGSASYTLGKYDESDDMHSWQGRLRLDRTFTKFLDGYVQYRQTYVEYDGESEDYLVYSPSAGLSYNFDQDGTASLGLGYYIRDEEFADENETGFFLDASINKTWDYKRSSFQLQGSSGYSETYSGAQNLGFTIYYQADAQYSYALRKNLDWNLSASYRHNDFKDQDPERKDHTYTVSTGFAYMFTRTVSLNLDYDWRLFESSGDEDEYQENRASLSISWRPQGWMWK